MDIQLIEFALIASATIFVVVLLIRSFIHSNRKHPFSERTARAVLRLSAWLHCVGVAHDAAILRYRVARRTPMRRLDSTDEREYLERVKQELV